MAYNEKIAARIRERLCDVRNIEEKEMFGGIAFMVNGKMCVGVLKDDMMCRIDPDKSDEALEQTGCRPMDFTGRPMKGWIYIDEHGMKNKKDLDYWIGLALEFNKKAKKSKK
ncbi:MAG TPA: TfoX/Sxy family protein [Chitinophagaceae bacterium]|nr:TfoX/Sxy family protein [Chitinophagaceae bacterium]